MATSELPINKSLDLEILPILSLVLVSEVFSWAISMCTKNYKILIDDQPSSLRMTDDMN